MPEFLPWPKIARLNRDIIITEKIDGTNACVVIERSLGGHDEVRWMREGLVTVVGAPQGGAILVSAQSRTRLISPASDNYGFAAWVAAHAHELAAGLGYGHHFGEWYGSGIQRRYGLDHKRFALFNSARWGRASSEFVPACCEVVPELYAGPFSQRAIEQSVAGLRAFGSRAVPGYMNPEGVVVWHTAARTSFKVTLDGDDKPKG